MEVEHRGLLVSLGERRPVVAEGAWLAPGSVVSGRVRIGAGSSIWYGASVRGDSEDIAIGSDSNLQDNAVIHADPGHPAVIGDRVSIGHAAVLHGCTVGDGVVVGMGAVVLNGAVIGAGAMVAAGAVVLEGVRVPPGALVAGVPAKVRRDLTESEREGMLEGINRYPRLADLHRAALEGGDPTGTHSG